MLLGRLAPVIATPRRARHSIEAGIPPRPTVTAVAHDEPPPEPASARTVEPHRQLMAAVLQRVMDDYQGGSDRRRRAGLRSFDTSVVRSAMAYVRSTDRAWPFSFENLCEALDLDAAALRVKLAALRRRATIQAEAARSAPAEHPPGERMPISPMLPAHQRVAGDIASGASRH